MNPSEPTPKTGLNCRECGADNPPDARECWLCLRSDWRGEAAARSEPSIAPRVGDPRIAWLMVLIGMAAVVCGIVVIEPISGVSLGILLALAWVITEIRAYRRDRRGRPMSTIHKTLMIIVVAFLLPFVVTLAMYSALFVLCATGVLPPFSTR